VVITRKKLKNKKKFILLSMILIALLGSGFALAKHYLFPSNAASVSDAVNGGQRLNVLLLGIDARDGDVGRTDSMILASIDTKTKQVDLLSIPRDTRVKIPGHSWDKINSAVVFGGPELSLRVVSDLLGIPVRYYVLADFNGFKKIVDILGGVTIDVDQDMYHDDDNSYSINLKKGVQRLNGDKALQYVRYRGYAMADIERAHHQQKFLMALAHEMFQTGTILKLPALVPEINRNVKTNLNTGDLLQLATVANKLKDGNMIAQTLPGQPVTIGDGSYWAVDPNDAKVAVAKLFNGETVEIVRNTPIDPKLIGVSSFTATPIEATPPEGLKQPITTEQNVDKVTKPDQNSKPAGKSPSLLSGSVTITPVNGSANLSTGTPVKSSSGSPGTNTNTSTNPGIPGASNSINTDGIITNKDGSQPNTSSSQTTPTTPVPKK